MRGEREERGRREGEGEGERGNHIHSGVMLVVVCYMQVVCV